MQKQYFELDPHGDVLLTLRHPNQHNFVWSSLRSELNDLFAMLENVNNYGIVKPDKPTASLDPNACE
jgi:hypothetical protein